MPSRKSKPAPFLDALEEMRPCLLDFAILVLGGCELLTPDGGQSYRLTDVRTGKVREVALDDGHYVCSACKSISCPDAAIVVAYQHALYGRR